MMDGCIGQSKKQALFKFWLMSQEIWHISSINHTVQLGQSDDPTVPQHLHNPEGFTVKFGHNKKEEIS